MDHNNNVTKPKHYQFSKPCNEVRDVIKDRIKRLLSNESLLMICDKKDLLYDFENSIKYLLRWFEKNGAEDLRKAQYCINEMLRILEDGENSTNQSTECKSSNDVSVVDLDKLWKQEHLKVHPVIRGQIEKMYNHMPIARFPPWS